MFAIPICAKYSAAIISSHRHMVNSTFVSYSQRSCHRLTIAANRKAVNHYLYFKGWPLCLSTFLLFSYLLQYVLNPAGYYESMDKQHRIQGKHNKPDTLPPIVSFQCHTSCEKLDTSEEDTATGPKNAYGQSCDSFHNTFPSIIFVLATPK